MWLCGATIPEHADDFFGDVVSKKIDRPAKCSQEPMKRPRDQQRDALGAGEAETLGHKLAEDDLQEREQAEHDDERNRMREDRRPGPGKLLRPADGRSRPA